MIWRTSSIVAPAMCMISGEMMDASAGDIHVFARFDEDLAGQGAGVAITAGAVVDPQLTRLRKGNSGALLESRDIVVEILHRSGVDAISRQNGRVEGGAAEAGYGEKKPHYFHYSGRDWLSCGENRSLTVAVRQPVFGAPAYRE